MTIDLREIEYLATFGQMILLPGIFEVLREQIANNVLHGSEYQLTYALNLLAQRSDLLGPVIDGIRTISATLPPTEIRYLHSIQHRTTDEAKTTELVRCGLNNCADRGTSTSRKSE
jgi:UTP-glucose-1-phosphate uridylyltransferase